MVVFNVRNGAYRDQREISMKVDFWVLGMSKMSFQILESKELLAEWVAGRCEFERFQIRTPTSDRKKLPDDLGEPHMTFFYANACVS